MFLFCLFFILAKLLFWRHGYGAVTESMFHLNSFAACNFMCETDSFPYNLTQFICVRITIVKQCVFSFSKMVALLMTKIIYTRSDFLAKMTVRNCHRYTNDPCDVPALKSRQFISWNCLDSVTTGKTMQSSVLCIKFLRVTFSFVGNCL